MSVRLASQYHPVITLNYNSFILKGKILSYLKSMREQFYYIDHSTSLN